MKTIYNSPGSSLAAGQSSKTTTHAKTKGGKGNAEPKERVKQTEDYGDAFTDASFPSQPNETRDITPALPVY